VASFTPEPKKPPKNAPLRTYRMLATASSIGMSLVVAIFLGLFGGMWLDKRLDTRPLFLIIGLLLGITAGFRNVIVISQRIDKAQREEFDE
jgi:ATP synthase protein I